jgi:DNA-binding PadR family transcriptional regulator
VDDFMTPARKSPNLDDPERHVPLTNLAFHILIALASGPRHGYGIIIDVEQRTEGGMRLRSGTLYTAIQRLQQDGLLEEADRPDGGARDDQRRRYYQLTLLGRQVARLEATRLAAMLQTARQRELIDWGKGS